ncbi:MAG TPA: S53 family peptidase [Gaiellales bacterium]|nr:S53 family peptidase [Gaiellales bacterium]
MATLGLVAAAAAAAPIAHASPGRGLAQRVTLRGTASPAVARGLAHVVGRPSLAQRVQAVVAFKPRNPALLHRLAMHSTGHGMSNAQIDRLFAPRPSTVAGVRAYLARNGLSVVDSTDMSLVVSGTVAATQHAFGVGLRLYRDARGFTYQAPDGNVSLPRGIASVVQSVSGLDTSLRLHTHYKVAKHLQRHRVASHTRVMPNSVTGCAAHSGAGGYLPQDLAAAYDYDGLIAGGDDGTGQIIGFVEFSNYRFGNLQTFENCFTGGSFSGNHDLDVSIGGGPTNSLGEVEVNLDLEVAAGAAPGADLRVYKAPNNLALGPVMWNHMIGDGDVDIVSDSWGLCEILVPPKLTSTENTTLELMAVAGMSFYVASGDAGSSDCLPVDSRFKFLAIDDPSGQPFATAVGGTNLKTAPKFAGRTETGWKGSGGGISINWPKPAFQKGATSTPKVAGGFCASGRAQCRLTPDIAMDAAPSNGYTIFSHGLGFNNKAVWDVVGGTSGAAPLIAGITADANHSAGFNLGYANPFIYLTEVAGDFHDIPSGNNNQFGGSSFTARSGFDMVTGRGSVIGSSFASELAGFTPVISPTFDTTKLTSTHPLNRKRVKKGAIVSFRGVLTDTTAGHPIPHRQILLLNSNGRVLGVDSTNTSGQWAINFKVKRRLRWHALFMGSGSEKGSTSRAKLVRIKH